MTSSQKFDALLGRPKTLARFRSFPALASSLKGYPITTGWASSMLDAKDENVLVLGPYRGLPSEHVRIPITEGICMGAITQEKTVIVGDVSAEPRDSARSLETRSEIVVPIRANGKIVGEIDIDSHTINAFGADDRSFLENCADVLGKFLEK